MEENAPNAVILSNAISINPLNWKLDDTYAPASENLGSLMLNEEASDYEITDVGADAQVVPGRGVIVTNTSYDQYAAAEFFGSQSFHEDDYTLYYNNIKDNVAKRIAAYQRSKYLYLRTKEEAVMDKNGELLLKKRQEYVQQQRDNIQQAENFYLQYAQMDQLLNKEAEETITPENLQERIEAEKQAGLAEKKIPEQPLTSGEIEKIQDEYAAIHAGEAMSSKQLKKAKKEYARKIERVEKANKIFNNFRAYESSMKKMLTGQIMGMGRYYHEDLFGHMITKEETNVKAAIWMNTFTGGSAIDMLDTADNLLISNDEATKEQAERKALEIEKMMDIFLNYDISKLKYKNSDDFLKNASERMMIGQFASQMDEQFESYRDLVDRGLLKKPLNPHLINEAQARAKLIQASMERTLNKLMLLSSEKYALRDRDSVGEYSDAELEIFAGMTAEQADRIVHGAYFYSRESADEDIEKYKYFSAAYNLRMLDKKGRSERFRRGDNPESFLDEYRKKVNEEYPVPDDYQEDLDKMYADEQKITTLKKDGIEYFRGSMKNRLKLHAQNVTRDKGSAAHIKDVAREFAYKTYPKHWKVLKDNKALRQQQIQKYYGILHRGKKIPDALLQKIEKDFEKKFELAEKADPSAIYESREEHSANVNKFLTDHGNEINAERRANAVLFLFSNMSETEKVKKYKAFLELYNYKPEKEKEKEKKEEKANRLKDANKELLKYFNEFDLKKLEFNEISDLSGKFAEIDQFLQVMTEVQGLPASMYLLGILNEEEFLTMQARMEVIIGYSYLFENAVSAGSTVLDALVDSEDMLAVENVRVNKKEIPEELKDELILDKENYESMTSDESNFELSQYLIARNGMEEAVNKSSFYKPGGKMEDALIAARGKAEEKLAKLKKEYGL